MKKYQLLLLSLLIVSSCSQGVKSNSDSVDSTDDESEISTTTSEAQKTDNIIKDHYKLAQENTNTVRLTKDSPDYVSSVDEMNSLEKQRQRLIEKINPKYSQYLGYNLWVTNYELLQSSHDLIKAVMREERLRLY